MKRLETLAAAAVMLALAACANPIKSKQDAANAMQRMGAAANIMGSQSGALTQNFIPGFTLTVQGKEGKATITFAASTDAGAQVTEDIVFDNYSADGTNKFDGNLHLSVFAVAGTPSGPNGEPGVSAQVKLKMSGDVVMSGEYDSHLVMDLTETAVATAYAEQGGATATVTLNGFVTADGTHYTWTNESVTVTAHQG